MSAVKVVSPAGKAGANVQLPDEIFGAKVNIPLMHQVVVAQRAAFEELSQLTPLLPDCAPPRAGATFRLVLPFQQV